MSSDEEGGFIPFKDRNGEWDDVVPVSQEDGPNPLVAIRYADEFIETMDYFRAMLKANELSHRSFDLTSEVIELNAANYTAWEFRRRCLDHVEPKINLADELEYTRGKVLESPKSYQLWFHRQSVVDKIGSADGELAFIASALEDDDKNYHAWAYRQWVLKRFSLWEGELAFTAELLEKDCRNNSAWNERYYVINNFELTLEVLESELKFSLDWISRVPYNESPFNYVRGLLKLAGHRGGALFFESLEKMRGEDPNNRFVMAMLVDGNEHTNTQESLAAAAELCTELAANLDVIRKPYWNYRAEKIQKALQAAS